MPVIELFDGFCLGAQEVDEYLDCPIKFRPWKGEELVGKMNESEKHLWSLYLAEVNKFVSLTGLDRNLILNDGKIADSIVIDINQAELVLEHKEVIEQAKLIWNLLYFLLARHFGDPYLEIREGFQVVKSI